MLGGGVRLADLGVATLGGAVTAVGVVVLLPWALVGVLNAFSALGALFGAPGRLAVQNLLRNPARAGATCTALVVGVGAAAGRQTEHLAGEEGPLVEVGRGDPDVAHGADVDAHAVTEGRSRSTCRARNAVATSANSSAASICAQ